MRFLIDMGIGTRVAAWLRDRGHEVSHLREENLNRLPDPEIFQKALAEHRVILTQDLDFAEITALSRSETVSVVVLRLRNYRSQHVIRRLRTVLPAVMDELQQGAIVSVEEARYRVRHLPIGTDPESTSREQES